MKSLSKPKIWLFATGQFGWSMLSGLISNWLVYFYQPDAAAQSAGQTIFIPQGRVIFAVFTVIGAITAIGRLFDAVTDPWIASMSDWCKSGLGRRISFMKWAVLPLALSFCIYAAPVILGILEGSMGRVTAMRITFSILAVIAFLCMLVPVFAIKEKEYVQSIRD